MDMREDHLCVECGTEMLEIDKDPNGDVNATCKRCVAEEDHDFDDDPHAVFNRNGERTDPQPEWKPSAAKPDQKPRRLMVDHKDLSSWAKLLDCDNDTFDQARANNAAIKIRALIKASEDRKAKRKGAR
jgi:hypothetical protein